MGVELVKYGLLIGINAPESQAFRGQHLNPIMTDQEPNQQDKPQSIDLSELQNLDFGPQWTTSKPSRAPRRDDSADGQRRPGKKFSKKPPFKKGRQGAERPVFKPVIDVQFFPDDKPFQNVVRAMRRSCVTYELFNIAKVVLEKPERVVAVIRPLSSKDKDAEKPGAKLFRSVPDNLPFLSEEEAVSHVIKQHIERFFELETVETEAPKGSFPTVNKCGMTGELLGPANYHRYQQLLQEHHARNLPHVAFDTFVAKIETIKEAEVVQQWVEGMTKATRYKFKFPKEGEEAPVFETQDAVRRFLTQNHKDQVVRPCKTLRLSGADIQKLPKGDIRRTLEMGLEHQRKFPLDTANHLRGRLRRQNFHLYKKGSKGVSYVCATKRKFRTEKTTFADSVSKLIAFIEANPEVSAVELPGKYLGLEDVLAKPKAEKEQADKPEAEAQKDVKAPAVNLTEEQQAQLKQVSHDLRWLVTEGYVVHYEDGGLYVSPARTEAEVAKIKKQNASGAKKSTEAKKTETPKDAQKPEAKAQESEAKEASEESTSDEKSDAGESASDDKPVAVSAVQPEGVPALS